MPDPDVTMTDLTEAKRLVEAATPGPWHAGHFGDENMSCQCRGIVDEGYAGGIATAHVDNGIRFIADGGNDCPPAEQARANMHLIAWTGTHLKALITAHETALRENEALREGMRRMVATYTGMEDGNGEPCPDVVAARALLGDRS